MSAARPRRSTGLSLIELMFGSLMVFAAAATMCYVLASASHYLAHERERALGLQVTLQKRGELMSTFGWQVWEGLHMATPLPAGFDAQVNLNDYSPEPTPYQPDVGCLANVGFSVTMPSGSHMAFQTLSHFRRVVDVVTAGPWIFFGGGYPYKQVHVAKFSLAPGSPRVPTLTNFTTMPPMPLVPPPLSNPTQTPGTMVASGMTLRDDASELVASDEEREGFHHLVNPTTDFNWPDIRQEQMYGDSRMGLIEGLAGDSTNTVIWCADIGNRCLWCWNRTTSQFLGPFAPPADQTPLLQPTQIAWDGIAGHPLWVTDPGNLCIRSYDPVANSWSPMLRPTTAPHLGAPRAITITPAGVYVADAFRLWVYQGGAWTAQDLPAGLQGVVNSVHYNTASNVLFVLSDPHGLWMYDCSDGLFYNNPIASASSDDRTWPPPLPWPTPYPSP